MLDKAEEYYDLTLIWAMYGNVIAGQARMYGNIGNVYMLRKNYKWGMVLRTTITNGKLLDFGYKKIAGFVLPGDKANTVGLYIVQGWH